ncbi:hypothetical protein KIN20_033050 [Parelaphostrongylus tenuis]|uniref:Uncharacterized protein n=1 Tax=Parelaphostrongylus tenuis TaxID=148309 RepID=A0AAD5R7X3_PARTN|nr:hypothetical protein KIN20_033050 [Parelaphostrongylus tenuis]
MNDLKIRMCSNFVQAASVRTLQAKFLTVPMSFIKTKTMYWERRDNIQYTLTMIFRFATDTQREAGQVIQTSQQFLRYPYFGVLGRP